MAEGSRHSEPSSSLTSQSACGQNPSAVLDYTRPETAHAFRTAFRKAAAIRDAQDDFCSALQQVDEAHSRPTRALAELGKRGVVVGAFPGLDEAGWEVETIVGVLRGDVKAMTHCYEETDMAQFIRVGRRADKSLCG